MTVKSSADAPALPLSPGEQLRLREKLFLFLAKQAERYTSGDSSSVPVETAQALLRSILFCLGLSGDSSSRRERELLDRDLEPEFQLGLERIGEKLDYGKRLWQSLAAPPPRIMNIAMRDTLRGIGTFWRRYDRRYFAHEIPCDIDYPLAFPVSERLLGVDYVNDYLARLAIEVRFVGHFPPGAVVPLLERCCPDYRGLLVNLFEPVAANAIGLTALGRETGGLLLASGDLAGLSALFEHTTRVETGRLLRDAAERLTRRQGESAPEYLAYLRAYGARLAERVTAVRDFGGLGGVFLTQP